MHCFIKVTLDICNLLFMFLVTLKAVAVWTEGHTWISLLIMFGLSVYTALRDTLPAELKRYARERLNNQHEK